MNATASILPIPQQKSRTATKNDLEKIVYTITGIEGMRDLKPLARSWLCWMIALARIGYSRISAPMGAITDAQFRSFGYTSSERSAYRALATLESLGFLRRRNFRGSWKHTVIDIDLDRLKFWLHTPTNEHVSTHLPSCQPLEPTNRSYPGSSVFNSNGQNSKTHANKNKTGGTGKRRYEMWSHGVLYTLGVVLEGCADKTAIIARARDDMRGANLDIDKKYTDEYWRLLPIAQRELIARNELIPSLRLDTRAEVGKVTHLLDRLLNRNPETSQPKELPKEQPKNSTPQSYQYNSAFEVSKVSHLLDAILGRSQDAIAIDAAAVGENSGVVEPFERQKIIDTELSCLNNDELRILTEAKKRTDNLRKNLNTSDNMIV